MPETSALPAAKPTRPVSAGRLHWQMRALPPLRLSDALDPGPILILAPHPDDETLGCGGLIATACAPACTPAAPPGSPESRPVHVLVLTDGAASHPHSRSHPAPRLARLREAESRQAAACLGLPEARVAFLGLPDARAPHHGPAFDAAAAAIARHAQATGARTILTSWRHDPHCDHLAASLLAARAAAATGAALYEYPVWGWTLPPRRLLQSGPVTGFRLDVSAHVAAKRRAIACHRSQLGQAITDDPSGFCLEPRFIELFTGGWEVFVAVPQQG